jgi:hypothetical protein
MTELEKELREFAHATLRPPPKETVSQWCERHVFIPAPQTQVEGYVRWDGREYCREFVDDFGNPRIADEVACFGSQTGKTTAIACGVAWCLVNDPCGILWVMPGLDLARSFSETRWIPILRSSPAMAHMIPTGAARHSFKTAQQQLGSSIVNFIGSNSPANLASRPARRVIMDEVEKFDEGSRGEADAVNLAEQRTKAFSNAQRFKTSTPALVSGLIWQEYQKGDQRRYFIPCYHCQKEILLAWSKEFTVMPLTGSEAFVTWDRSAKRADGGWDLARVERSARAECPHCGGHLLDGHKTKMVRNGVWRATAPAPSSFRSRQLSSLYASTPETSFGRLAVKFLQAKQSLLGLQGFINGDLAEPYSRQEMATKRIEVVSHQSIIKPGENWEKFMTVDVQERAPRYWWVVRAWNMERGDSEGVASGFCGTDEELFRIQEQHGVKDCDVVIDSGYDTQTVYRLAMKRSVRKGYQLIGWIPAKGFPPEHRFTDQDTGVQLPWAMKEAEPYPGSPEQGLYLWHHLHFTGDVFKDLMEAMREGRGGYRWAVGRACGVGEYWRHLRAKNKTTVTSRLTGHTRLEWTKTGDREPDHLDDCEVMQLAYAASLQLFATNQ